MRKLMTKRLLDGVLVDSTAIAKTDRWDNLLLIVNYVRSGSSTGTITVYGAMDANGVVKYPLGIAPVINGTRDADGAIAYTTSSVAFYEVPGVHPYIYVDWNEGTDGATITVDLYGMEDR